MDNTKSKFSYFMRRISTTYDYARSPPPREAAMLMTVAPNFEPRPHTRHLMYSNKRESIHA
jgi:hypothetical protein